MAIKKGLNWTIIGALALGMILFMSLFSSADEPETVKHQTSALLELPRADHDTNENTIKTFTASNESLMQKTQTAMSELIHAKRELTDKSNQLDSEAKKYEKIMYQNERQEQLIQDLEHKYNQLNIDLAKNQPENLADFGINTHDKSAEPLGAWIGSDQSFQSVDLKKNNKAGLSRAEYTKKNEETPLYTIPTDAVLYDAKALTALIGRIPIDSSTQDPFPAKMLIGKENLLASGFDMPEIHAMIVSGEAHGDWNLSCVRVQIQTATFIYQDGSITTHGKKGAKEGIGYISDRQGVPCISGKFVSNASRYIGTSVGLAALGAVGEAYAEEAQTRIYSPNSGLLSTFTDNVDHLIAGEAVDSATQEIISWIKDRMQNSFDAVVVPPGQNVSVHLDEAIEINQSPKQRKVRYAQINTGRTTLLD